MPKVEQLPDSLKDFAYRSGQKVDTGSDFDYHVDRLIRAMDKLLAANSQRVIEARGIAPELELGTSLSQPFLSGTLPTAPASHRTSAPAGDVPPVLLAEVTEDLESERLEMRRSLEGHGLQVLPKASYPLGRSEFEAAIDADLAHCSLFVQLLGPSPGKQPSDAPDGYCWLQLECALRRSCRILQWRSPELDPAIVDLPRHRDLLRRETVQAVSFEKFEDAVCATALTWASLETPRAAGDRPLIFLNTEQRHRLIAGEIRAAIGDRAETVEPLFQGHADEVRKDLDRKMTDCDAMVMVYADNPSWLRGLLNQFRKLAPHRAQQIRAITIIDVPPSSKPAISFDLPGMIIIDGRGGIGPEVVARLSASLRL